MSNQPNIVFVFPDQMRGSAMGFLGEELCKRPNVPPAGTRWGDYYRANIRYQLAMITGVDEQFGRILQALDEQGLRENTIVLFTFDHGDCLGAHEKQAKCNAYEESMRIPLLVRWPSRIPARHDPILFSAPDVYPTLLGLLGLSGDIPPDVESRGTQAQYDARMERWVRRPLRHVHLPGRLLRARRHVKGETLMRRILAILILCMPWCVSAEEFHVSSQGSDENSGTRDMPFRTLTHAAARANAGDTVVIRAGVYRETLRVQHSGTKAQPVTFMAEDGERVLISGADLAGTYSCPISLAKAPGQTTGENRIWFNTIRRTGRDCIQMYGASGDDIRYNDISDSGKRIEGFTNGFRGKAPDLGAYEAGGGNWVPGKDGQAEGVVADADWPLGAYIDGQFGISNLRPFRVLEEDPPLVITDLPSADRALETADNAWRSGSPAQAAERYSKLLAAWPPQAEPIRASVILRLARARAAAKDTSGSLEALALLDGFDYVPEHIELATGELKAVLAGEPHPGQQCTPIPPVGTVRASFSVGAGGDYLTLHEAVAAARAERKKPGSGALEIVIAPGTYRMSSTVQLTAADAGTSESPLVIRSQYPDRPAVLTAGVTLSTWTQVVDPALRERLLESVRDSAMVCDLSDHNVAAMGELVFGGFSSRRAEGGDHRFATFPVPELFYKGEPQTMARWPNDKLTRLPIDETPRSEQARFLRWAREKDLWLYGYWSKDWADAYEKVAAIEADGTIRLEPPTNRYGFGQRQGCAVNALCELDQPGEWYLDVAGNRVVYLPPEDFDPQACVLSCFNTVIEASTCSHLQLRDLDINFVRGDALIFLDCSDLLLVGLDVQNCSGLGLRIRGGERHLVHSCRIQSMGRGGIDLLAGDWQKLDPAHSVVENCHISKLSRIDRTYSPALLLEGMGLKVRHNAFIDIPSSAIRLEACDALIELNHFRRCVYESGDQGAIDMWANPLYRGNVIRWNDFDRIVNHHAPLGAAAVRCDDYISGFMIAENVMRKGSPRGFGSVQFNKGTDNYVEGNMIVDWLSAFSGSSAAGRHWTEGITGHPNSGRMLSETPWQSEAWRKKYPMVRDLMNGGDNHNYMIGNILLGSGGGGGVGGAISIANRRGSADVHGETLAELEADLVPWYPIPLNRIGPYEYHAR